ncbi:hypothetical protein TSTA_021380 [Talaromyces stipitatus ATCC 10500]|uniref:Uncharacterized protein n=1 Tax=Talaromyces stipitatus (strain ATCC 10500 / CBS 375.48 / QM 6759 / NRRL 1006) TaxID=441959 RepID=B8MHA2_TALSN|nr:uncharacterized protein TSTA_021380 [Talaromyces stipitatus ATCC 10500]EED17081.1 hypothetical protein TSTA_021380 [Talaromyces stipitatus ATCC 10500]
MSSRLDLLDLRSGGSDSARGSPTPRMPSPRIQHFDGEIPPTLSPLDAFAMQGRLLARQLDESMRRDRRMSRLPPQSVARSLSQPRPDRAEQLEPDPSAHHAFEEDKIRLIAAPRIAVSMLHSESVI